MKVNSDALDALKEVRAVNLETDLVRMLAEYLSLSVDEALRVYYESDFSNAIAENKYGEQYLDATYLFDELMKQLEV